MTTSLGYLDAKSKSIVWAAYAEHFAGEEIMEEGYNSSNGVIYMALENGVTIASSFGQDVFFVVFDDSEEKSVYGEISFYSINELNEYLNAN